MHCLPIPSRPLSTLTLCLNVCLCPHREDIYKLLLEHRPGFVLHVSNKGGAGAQSHSGHRALPCSCHAKEVSRVLYWTTCLFPRAVGAVRWDRVKRKLGQEKANITDGTGISCHLPLGLKWWDMMSVISGPPWQSGGSKERDYNKTRKSYSSGEYTCSLLG